MTKILTESILPILIILPLVLFFIKDKSHFKTIGLFVLIFITYQVLLKLPMEYSNFQVIKGNWNWTGKLLGIFFGVIVYVLLRKRLIPFDFCKIEQFPKSKRKTIIASIIIICTALFSWFDSHQVFDSETLFYQISMPGLDEEIMFRAVLLGLLLSSLKDKIKMNNKTFGNPSVLIIGILFGLVHGLSLNNELKLNFELYSFIWTMLFGYAWSWITFESKSILQPIISHNLLNFLSNLIGMIN